MITFKNKRLISAQFNETEYKRLSDYFDKSLDYDEVKEFNFLNETFTRAYKKDGQYILALINDGALDILYIRSNIEYKLADKQKAI